MTQIDKSAPATPATGLSPVKQALVEIRRLRAELDDARRGQREPIAVVGMAVRLPGRIASPERFWQALAAGEDLIGTIPPERWRADSWCGADPDEPGTMYDIHGGFLDDIELFDAEFFGIHAREAASMDPQHRILLELSWEALERSGIDPRSLADSSTGVWLGLSNSDYARRLMNDPVRIDGYTGIGAAASMAAGHIAYLLGLHGPAEVLDTACSSSLVAIHHAVQSLRCGETGLAIVGGANLMLSPEIHVSFSRTGMLSRTGHCRTFDAEADGYARSEGCAVVVLRRLSDALRLGDRVLAVIRGSAVNQDGRSAGITAPNGPAQEAVMRAALRDAGLAPGEIGYVEAHGTGTPLGDPMEWRAIGSVYGDGRSPSAPLYVGSVKTNLGHTEAAAGLVGLIKAILMLEPGRSIPQHLHFTNPNPKIDWEHWPMRVPTAPAPWHEGVRRAAVSSFGFSGTNAHVILESPAVDAALASRAALPLTSFNRKRFWFGDSPVTEWQKDADRAWQSAIEAAATQSHLGPLGWNPQTYPERWAALERLMLAHAAATLAALPGFPHATAASLDEVMDRCKFRSIYRRLVQRWLRALVRDGQLVEADGRYAPVAGANAVDLESCWRDVEHCLAHEPGTLSYFRRCGMLLPAVLTGKVDPLETLFPDGSFSLAEAIYEEGAEARYSNRIVAESVRAFVEHRTEKRRIRLLELGGGTGGTTAAVLPLLRSALVEYWFTDVSELFLNRARRKFAAFDCMRYALIDLDHESQPDSMRSGSFDVILAANVVHASRNIPAALDKARRLLAPGGALVLLETTTHQACFDMSIGLIEGWQHFEDSERADHPLLDAATWCEQLRRSGFEAPTFIPESGSPAAWIGQHILLARRSLQDAERTNSSTTTGQSQQPPSAVPTKVVVPTPAMLLELSSIDADDRADKLAACVRQTICRVFGLQISPDELGDRDRLSDLGMDSLIALELRGELAKALGLAGRIPSTIAFDTGTVGELTRSLASLIEPGAPESEAGTTSVSPAEKPVAVTAETLEGMTEEHVERLLMERMKKR
ncbi:MAG TPA: beta-ketoacyl synthase N-terminal-like domain-containing protein [Acidobacteriaceae bacterium]|jgi:3-oxoacyl-(acyl-carrier-protein) synthase/SAM-dependent methyltransferase/acyl carrier protein|nr:beta-ketoacyl synthase N-terminal-like domain-containing protein [Acidobacteriaceae bacterium]